MTHETTAPVQSLHDQIMRLPCTPPKDANVNQSISYKSGHRDARHAAAELAAEHEAEQQQELTAIEAMARMLADGEWAEHVGMLGGPIAQRLETEITRMHNEQQEAQAAVPDDWKAVPVDATGEMVEALKARIGVTSRGGILNAGHALNAAISAAPTPPAGPWESPCTQPAQQPVALKPTAVVWIDAHHLVDDNGPSLIRDVALVSAERSSDSQIALCLIDKAPVLRHPVSRDGMQPVGHFIRRSRFGPHIEVDPDEKGAYPLYADPPAQQSQWVPVSERLPEIDTPVFLYEPNFGIWIGGCADADDGWMWAHAQGTQWFADGKWKADLFIDDDYKPSHWMTLPAAPGDTAAPERAEQSNDEPTPPEVLASRLISVWVETHGKPIPWAHAVRITGIATNLPQQEIDRLLAMDDAVTVPIHERWAEVESICWRIFEDGKKEFRGCTKERLEELRDLLGGGA